MKNIRSFPQIPGSPNGFRLFHGENPSLKLEWGRDLPSGKPRAIDHGQFIVGLAMKVVIVLCEFTGGYMLLYTHPINYGCKYHEP